MDSFDFAFDEFSPCQLLPNIFCPPYCFLSQGRMAPSVAFSENYAASYLWWTADCRTQSWARWSEAGQAFRRKHLRHFAITSLKQRRLNNFSMLTKSTSGWQTFAICSNNFIQSHHITGFLQNGDGFIFGVIAITLTTKLWCFGRDRSKLDPCKFPTQHSQEKFLILPVFFYLQRDICVFHSLVFSMFWTSTASL